MGTICEICGQGDDRGFLGKLLTGGGSVFQVKTCPTCGITFCSNCGVFPKGTKMVTSLNAASKVVCPRCNGD